MQERGPQYVEAVVQRQQGVATEATTIASASGESVVERGSATVRRSATSLRERYLTIFIGFTP